LIGNKVWFGPRHFGWGLEPVSPEGWIATFAFAALSLALRRLRENSRHEFLDSAWFRYTVAGGCFVFALLKGTAPGGAAARANFDAARAAAAPGDPAALAA
jgi:hypothetical protein